MTENNFPFLIAEIGCNHKGDFKTALENDQGLFFIL